MSSKSNSDSDTFLVFKSGSISLLGKVVGRGMHVVTQALLARHLGPAAFGLYAIGWIILNLLGTFGMMGLNRGAVRFMGRQIGDESRRKLIYQSLFASGLTAVAFTLILICFAEQLESWFKEPGLQNVLLMFAPAIFGTVLMRVTSAISTSTHKIQYAVLIEDLAQPFANLTMVGLAILFFSFTIEIAIGSSLLSFFVGAILGLFFIWNIFFKGESISKLSFKSLLNLKLIKFSVVASLAGSITILTGKVDKLIIGLFLSSKDVGLYQASGQLTIVFAVVIGSMTGIFLPLVVKLHAQGKKGELNQLYQSVSKLIIYASIPLFVLLFIFSKEIMELVYGSQYSASHNLLRILCVAQLANVLSGPIAPLLIMTGHQKHWLLTAASAFIMNVVANIILINLFGIVGSAYALILTMSMLTTIGLYLAKRKLGVWPFRWNYLKGLTSGLFLALAIWVAKFLLEPIMVWDLLGIVFLAIGVYGLGLFVLGLEPEDKALLEDIKKKFA